MVADMNRPIRVTIWNEFLHEQTEEHVRGIYPEGIHGRLAQGLDGRGPFEIRCATLHDPEQGLAAAVLDETDVLVWWGHRAHAQVGDEAVLRVRDRVWAGMGLVALHSAHFSKIFIRLLGTPCTLRHRVAAEREMLWVVDPHHPIARGVPDRIVIEQEEMYGEPFAIPSPDEIIFLASFAGGEVFRAGCTWRRGAGRIFYFQPGHETYPIYHHADILQVIANGIQWAAHRI